MALPGFKYALFLLGSDRFYASAWPGGLMGKECFFAQRFEAAFPFEHCGKVHISQLGRFLNTDLLGIGLPHGHLGGEVKIGDQ